MKLKTLSTAILFATVPMTGAFAAALDRSGQSIAAFLQPGNYFEAGISILDPNVSGKVKNGYTPSAAAPSALVGLENTKLSDMGEDYYFPQAALKFQVTDNFSVGLIYDQPFGADAAYSAGDASSTAPVSSLNGQGLFHNGTEATEVEVKTQNISAIVGFQPNQNWNIYAGAVYQTVEGDVQLRGLAYGGPTAFGAYDAKIKEESGIGWLAGFAYQIPDIALKASVTYRSEIDHNADAAETIGGNDMSLLGYSVGKTEITTPQSVNLDFQTGIMADTVAFANVRWVDWSNFSIRPNQFGQHANAVSAVATGGLYNKGFNLVDYSDDQISATLGLGRKLSEQWAGNISVGWDSGAGNPVSTLGPTEGYWNLGLGLQFSPTPATFIAGGVKYFWLGDATAQSGSYSIPGNTENAKVANFEDNDAWGFGLKMGYRF